MRTRPTVAMNGTDHGALCGEASPTGPIRTASTAVNNALHVGEMIHFDFLRVNAQIGSNTPCVESPSHGEGGNPFDAQNPDTRPASAGSTLGDPLEYFVGSAAICSANVLFSGNDNHAFYLIGLPGLELPGNPDPPPNYLFHDAETAVCSSPAIAYIHDAEENADYRWVFVVSRSTDGGPGSLIAFKQARH